MAREDIFKVIKAICLVFLYGLSDICGGF